MSRTKGSIARTPTPTPEWDALSDIPRNWSVATPPAYRAMVIMAREKLRAGASRADLVGRYSRFVLDDAEKPAPLMTINAAD